jgi:hypothetical protein
MRDPGTSSARGGDLRAISGGAAAPDESFESGIGPPAIPLGIDGEEDEVLVAVGVGLIEPLERRRVLAQAA